MTEPTEVADPDEVHVPRRELADLGSLLRGVVAGGVVFAVSFGWFVVQQERTNDRLSGLIKAEAAEDRREDAGRCLDDWAAWHDFAETADRVAEAGARNAVRAVAAVAGADQAKLDQALALVAELNQSEVDPLLAEHPEPSCDEEAARRVIDG